MVELPTIECPKCKHVWTPRVQKPEKCPNCGLKLNQLNRGGNRMSEENKDREERFANNHLYKNGGFALENAFQPIPRDTSIEGMEEWAKEQNYRKKYQHIQKIFRLARPLVSNYAKYDLFNSEPQPMPEELIKAKDTMPVYQVKVSLEGFRECKDALRRTKNQFDKWLSQINEAELQENNEICISFEPPTGGSKNSLLRGIAQRERFKKEIADEKMIIEEAEKYYDALIPAFEQELKDRANPEKVKEIIVSANKLVKEHIQLAKKVQDVVEKPIKTFQTAQTFIDGRERMRIIESELHVLEDKLYWYETPPKTTFPSLNGLTSGELHYVQYMPKTIDGIIKEIERIYREETEKRKEATTKA